MPRLFDLLPDSNTKKELIAEAKKASAGKKNFKNEQGKQPLTQNKPKTENQFTNRILIEVPDFVAFDVETTGLDFKNDRIIEIGAVKFIRGKPSEEFSTFINPGKPIPPYITDLTGISDKDVECAPAFSEISEKLLGFFGQLPLCGHQIEFDATFVNEELKRIQKQTLSSQFIDTVLLSRIILQPLGRFSLKSVSESLEVTLDNAHRALHDARASGEVAVQLIPKLGELSLSARQTMAACAPGSLFKSFIIKTLGPNRPFVRIETNRSPLNLSRLSIPEQFKTIERETIDDIFSENGVLEKSLDTFSPRPSQKEMALQVTDAMNTQSILVAEAGTGTGKSLAYIIPSALWALKNNCRVIVSTRTRNLQDQLVQKDLPIVAKIAGEKLRFSVLKGRGNYLCLTRWHKLLRGEIGNLSPRERFAILPLIPWSENSETGDIEEQNQFNPKWFTKIWNLLSAENHDCAGRRCANFGICFLQQARQKALGSHIVVINHALFFSEIISENSFLGKIGSIVFDEAHHLESSGHRHLRVELDTSRVNLFIDVLNNLVLRIGELKDEKQIYENGKELKSQLKNLRKRSHELLNELDLWAYSQNNSVAEYQIGYPENSFEGMTSPSAFELILNEIVDRLHLLRQAVISSSDTEKYKDLEPEILVCSEKTSQLKADLLYLIAGKTDDHVFWIEGNHEKGWTKLCGVPLDIGNLLSEIWDRCSGSIIFTSATLSISKSIDYFKRAAGLFSHERRLATGFFKSPFGPHQLIMGGMKTAPDPDSPGFPAFIADSISKIHFQIAKNILVLFTSNSMLSSVYEILRSSSNIGKDKILAQGLSGTRYNILDQFKKNQNMILLGTDSFWEGVDVPGEACEVVIIPRLPFPVPTHPLTQAISKRMENLNGESFFSYSVPEAVIKYRQGAGRLIRSTTDRGALVVLDNRILSKGYGKQFIRSIEGDFKNFEDQNDMILKIKEFFDNPLEISSSVTYVPLEDL
jgi:ATP-dependent DNA helicase DinG